MTFIAPWWMWVGFIIFILLMLTIDLFAFGGRKAHEVSIREALSWWLIWIVLALVFNFLLWGYINHEHGLALANQKSLEFFTGFVLEESLSVDNMFVFIMIFSFFHVPAEYQRRVLLYGVLGAIVMRAFMIVFGVWIFDLFDWLFYVFGAILIITGARMMFLAEHEKNLAKNPVLRFLKNHMNITEDFVQEKFFVRRQKILYATPLFLALILIELSDLIFAIDSIPAILAITRDVFIVFTSNIFAILGLRALYFLLANIAQKFYLLRYGIALILIYIGAKMIAFQFFHIPTLISLSVILTILTVTIFLSMISARHRNKT